MSVRCGRSERAKPYPSVEGYSTIPAWSRGASPWNQLSPMKLGPFVVDDEEVQIFENYWQSKIYQCDLIDETKPIEINNLKTSYWERRTELFKSTKAKRRALPKAKYGVPIAGYYHGQIMGYVESRKLVYCPIYTALVEQHPIFLQLKEKYNNGEKLLIIGPDGSNHNEELTLEILRERINDPTRIFGHELVLCCLLMDYKVWEN